MADLNKIYLYRMIHIENIPHVLQNGLTHSTSPNANQNYIPIGDGSLIKTRGNFILQNGNYLGDYIPFYFGARMPMLLVVQTGFNVTPTSPEDIVYCVTSVQKIIDLNLDFVFTDGHAVATYSKQYSKDDIQDIDTIIDKDAIKAKYWKDDNDLDKKRRKEAEFLVLGDINTNAILGYLVYNEYAKTKLIKFGVDETIILINPNYFF